MTSKLHDFSVREQELKEKLRLRSYDSANNSYENNGDGGHNNHVSADHIADLDQQMPTSPLASSSHTHGSYPDSNGLESPFYTSSEAFSTLAIGESWPQKSVSVDLTC